MSFFRKKWFKKKRRSQYTYHAMLGFQGYRIRSGRPIMWNWLWWLFVGCALWEYIVDFSGRACGWRMSSHYQCATLRLYDLSIVRSIVFVWCYAELQHLILSSDADCVNYQTVNKLKSPLIAKVHTIWLANHLTPM